MIARPVSGRGGRHPRRLYAVAILGTRHNPARACLARRIVGLVAAAALLAGCGDDSDSDSTSTTSDSQPPTAGVFVGAIEGTNAYIALVTDGERLSGGYLSDSKDLSTWLSPADLPDGPAELTARRGEAVGEASFSGDSASGEVALASGSRSFSAALATGKAGLYRTDSGKAGAEGYSETGWIVLPDGSVRARTNINAAEGFETEPAPSDPKGQVTDFADPYGF